MKMESTKLHLRTTKSNADLAQEAALLFWNHLAEKHWDVHRFPAIAEIFHRLLNKHIGPCVSTIAAQPYDPWARTGGGTAAEALRRPVCAEHIARISESYREALTAFRVGLEKELWSYLTRNTMHREAFDSTLRSDLRRVLNDIIAPHLYRNIESPGCADCIR